MFQYDMYLMECIVMLRYKRLLLLFGVKILFFKQTIICNLQNI